jgi:hypothetical protein
VRNFLKPALFSLFLLVVVGEARAQLKAGPSSLNLGRRQQQQSVAAEVMLTNAGSGPLEITGVNSGCSCTVATPEKRLLAPGESTPLKIVVETRTYQGLVHRNVHVQTSAGELSIPIEVTVSLFKSWQLNPAVIVLPPSQKGRAATMAVTLEYTGGDKAGLGKIVSTPAWLEATATSADGKVFSINFVKRPEAPAGNHTVKVVVESSDQTEPQLTFNVFVPVTSDLRVTPNPVVLPTIKVGQSASHEIVINGWSGTAEPRLELNQGQARKLEQESGRFRFEIVITPAAPGPLTQLLRIYDGESLEAEVPVIVRAEPIDRVN